jgi:hypothetical protein
VLFAMNDQVECAIPSAYETLDAAQRISHDRDGKVSQ